MTVHRRDILSGLGALLAAPAIVKASSLMAIKPVPFYEKVVIEGWDADSLSPIFTGEYDIKVVYDTVTITWPDIKGAVGYSITGSKDLVLPKPWYRAQDGFITVKAALRGK